MFPIEQEFSCLLLGFFNTKMRQTEKILDYVLKNKVSLLVLVIKALLNNHVNKKKC